MAGRTGELIDFGIADLLMQMTTLSAAIAGQ
jgi:hypothetical protein